MKIYNHKRRNVISISPHLLGLIFIVVGLFTILSPGFMESDSSIGKAILVGGVSILFGISVVFSYGGTLINFNSYSIKEYYSLCGLKMGNWKKISEIKKVKVVSEQYKFTRSSDGIHPSNSGQVWIYKALLYSSNPKPILTFEFPTKDKTLKEAKILADNFGAVLELRLTETNGIYSV
jgi:hypothetical protein